MKIKGNMKDFLMHVDKRIVIAAGVALALVVAGLVVRSSRHGHGTGQPAGEDKAEISHYTCPMHPQIHEEKPGECPICHMKLVPVYKERAPAGGEGTGHSHGPSVRISSERQQMIGVRTTAVVREPFFKEIRTVGRVAFDPDLAVAQREYVEIVRNVPELKEASRARLRLMGMADDEIKALEKRGKVESNLFLPADGDSVWVYATLYQGEYEQVSPGMEVRIEDSKGTVADLTGFVRAVDPVVDPMTRSVRARIEVAGAGGQLKPDSYVTVRFKIDLGEVLSVPKSAVVDTGNRKVAFVVHDGEHFEARELKTGSESEENVVVLEGIEEGETVVAHGAFLIDSESQLKAAVSDMGGHQH